MLAATSSDVERDGGSGVGNGPLPPLASVATGGASEPSAAQLEVLEPATARAEVAKSEGLVLVDLYADW